MTLTHYVKTYVILLLLLSVGGLILLRQDLSGNTRLEYREPSEMPTLPRSFGAALCWPSLFDAFVNDHFPGRSFLIHSVAAISYRLGMTISPQVIIGEEPWLFLTAQSDVLTEHRGLSTLTAQEARNWVHNYQKWQRYFSKRGIRLVLAIIPNKHTIYKDYLPAHYFSVGPTIREILMGEVAREGIADVIDLTQTLAEAAQSRRVYRYHDTHWNDEGVRVGFEAIMTLLGIPSASSALDIEISTQTRSGDLARLAGLVQLQEAVPIANVRAKADGPLRDERIFVLGDSFFPNRLEKFLTPAFSEVAYQHHGPLVFPLGQIADFAPDILLLAVAERLITKSLAPPP